MKVFAVVEIAVVLFLVTFLVTQIIWPLWRGLPLFPILRSKGRKVEAELAEAKEDVETHAREAEIKELRARLVESPAPTTTTSAANKPRRKVNG